MVFPVPIILILFFYFASSIIHPSRITPISTRIAKVIKMIYKKQKTKPTLLRKVNFENKSTSHRQLTATRREPTTKSILAEFMRTAGCSRPWLRFTRHLISHGMPRANKIANELAPRALDTPIPPSPVKGKVISTHYYRCQLEFSTLTK